MEKIEREVKILNIDVNALKLLLSQKKISCQEKIIQDVYTFDMPSVDELYLKYVNTLIATNDKRGLEKLVVEIRPCFSKEDLSVIKTVLGTLDILEFIKDPANDFKKLLDEKLIKLIKTINNRFSKWIRLRKSGNLTTITIKKVVNGHGIYQLDAVKEFEIPVPSLEDGEELLANLGYFFARHQVKMRLTYNYKNAEIVIDKWPRLAPYLEIEAPSKEEIEEVILMLGYKLEDAIVMNTDDVYKAIGIDIYSKEYKDLCFTDEELKEVKEYLS